MTDDVKGKKMVVGFMFCGPQVLLVRKNRPEWQAGLLNGVGGVIADNETPIEAMVREFREETTIESTPDLWTHYATEQEPFGAWVYFFSAWVSREVFRGSHPTHNDVGEKLRMVNWHDLDSYARSLQIVGNLSWLIPLALDPRGFTQPVLIQAKGDITRGAAW